jgi:hypothetical protein
VADGGGRDECQDEAKGNNIGEQGANAISREAAESVHAAYLQYYGRVYLRSST